jgi:hypothetical protein
MIVLPDHSRVGRGPKCGESGRSCSYSSRIGAQCHAVVDVLADHRAPASGGQLVAAIVRFLIMNALTRRWGFSGRQPERSIHRAADQVWLRHQLKDRLFRASARHMTRCMPRISRPQARSISRGHPITNRLGT